MRRQFSKLALAATLGFALAFTFGCSSDDDGGGGDIGPCIDGTVKIDTQTWQKCNLNVEPSTGVSRCYKDDPANCQKYGRIYNWATAMALPSSCNSTTCSDQVQPKHRGICPSGWHIPSKAEWDALASYVESDKGCTRCDAKHLKAKSGWKDVEGAGNGLDSYGFSALPGGFGSADEGSSYGLFVYIGEHGIWWSASESESEMDRKVLQNMISYGAGDALLDDNIKGILISVRCLKD